MKKVYTCIVCPIGCRLCVTDDGAAVTVSGNRCKRGKQHGLNEYSDPTRMLTTTIALSGAYTRRLPVISTREIPKRLMNECLRQLYQTCASAPIEAGTVIVQNIRDTGADIIAARSIRTGGK